MSTILKWVLGVLAAVLLIGALILGWARPIPEKEVQVTREVTKVVESVVKETVVVERLVTTSPLPATSAPTLTPTPQPTPTFSRTEALLATLVARSEMGQQVQAQAAITASLPVTVSESLPLTTTVVVTNTVAITQGNWTISVYPGATTEMRSWQFRNPDPKLWKSFPNVDNGVYKVGDGVEYGMAESVFCQQGQRCDIIVAARHYRLITGDYDTVFGKCAYGDGGAGCALLIVNVGDQTVAWRDQTIDTGFTVTGRYWNGDKLDQAIWAVVSNAAYNMLNLSGEGTNAGANCSSPSGCPKVRLAFAVTSGTEVLVKGTTFVSR